MLKIQCPCGSDQDYQQCCEPLHLGKRSAANPETLMRSRYSAFVKECADYLIATHHPSKHAGDDKKQLSASIANTQWLGLKVISHSVDGDKGSVEFAAWFHDTATTDKTTEETLQMHERSRFIKEEGRWYYLEGEQLEPYKVPRNELCWCGSGKKSKRCQNH
jgi:SEC-C motif-containing protein